MPTADTEIRLIDLADADALAVHQARDREASARWESARPDVYFTPAGQRIEGVKAYPGLFEVYVEVSSPS